MNLKPNILVLVTALAFLLTPKIQGQTTSPPYLSQFPSPDRIKADVRGVDAMETAAKQAGICWLLRQLIYDLALSQRRTDRQFTPDEQRLEVEYRNAHYKAIEPFEGKVTGADKPKWFELRGKYEMDLWLRDEVFKKYFTPELRRAVYVALKGEMPTTNAPEGSRLTPSATSLAAAARPSTSTASSMSQPSASAGLSADDYADQGKKYFEAKDFEKAIGAFKKAIALNASHVRALFFLAATLTYNVKGQQQLAISTWKQFLALPASDVETREIAFVGLGNAYRGLAQYDEALKAFRNAISLKPKPDRLASVHEWVGWVYLDMKQNENALSSFQEALRIDPNNANAHRDSGVAYYQLKQFSQALESLQRAIRLKPDNANAHLWLGMTYVKLGKKDDALQVYNRLLTLDKEQAQKLYADINSEPTGNTQSVKTTVGNSPKSNQSPSSSGGGPVPQTKALPPTAKAATQKTWAAARAGDANAQNSLGWLYQNGRGGVSEDKAEARKWYHLAAEQGNASGKVHLCSLLDEALHISDERDDDPSAPIQRIKGPKTEIEEAFKWCTAAANIGYVGAAKTTLGLLYAKGGAGLSPDYEQAYFWLSMVTFASEGEGVLRNKVGQKLTPAKRAEIEQSAKAWKPPAVKNHHAINRQSRDR
jgi:tetratricopeptide (TPR) repeat protein